MFRSIVSLALVAGVCVGSPPWARADISQGTSINTGGNNGRTNNGRTNNGRTNNGRTNNGRTNNGHINNGRLNNGHINNRRTNNGHINNGHINNGRTNNGRTNNGRLNNGHINNGRTSNGRPTNNGRTNNGRSTPALQREADRIVALIYRLKDKVSARHWGRIDSVLGGINTALPTPADVRRLRRLAHAIGNLMQGASERQGAAATYNATRAAGIHNRLVMVREVSKVSLALLTATYAATYTGLTTAVEAAEAEAVAAEAELSSGAVSGAARSRLQRVLDVLYKRISGARKRLGTMTPPRSQPGR